MKEGIYMVVYKGENGFLVNYANKLPYVQTKSHIIRGVDLKDCKNPIPV